MFVVAAVTTTQGVILGLAQNDFNLAVEYYDVILQYFRTEGAAWTPELGLDLEHLAGVLPAGNLLANALVGYSGLAAKEFSIGAAVFIVTAIVS